MLQVWKYFEVCYNKQNCARLMGIVLFIVSIVIVGGEPLRIALNLVEVSYSTQIALHLSSNTFSSLEFQFTYDTISP